MTSRPRRDDRRFPIAMLALPLAVAGIGLAGCHSKPTPGPQAAVANPVRRAGPPRHRPCRCNRQPDRSSTARPGRRSSRSTGEPIRPRPGRRIPRRHGTSSASPGDPGRTVWESYHEAAEVFGGNGEAPLQGTWRATRPAIKTLGRTAKTGPVDLTEHHPGGGGGHHRLTNQRGEVTYYEVMMNEDEFEYITQEGFDLTTAAGQLTCATQPGKPKSDGRRRRPRRRRNRGGLNMPVGQAERLGRHRLCRQDTGVRPECRGDGDQGSLDAVAGGSARSTIATRPPSPMIRPIRRPATRQVTVGLVGMHIARKRFPRLPWMWATFEHIDNSPDEAAAAASRRLPCRRTRTRGRHRGYTFFDATCTPATDPVYKCGHNVPPRDAARHARPATAMPYKAPMQITRINPVAEPANDVTAYVWSLLPANRCSTITA